MPAPIPQNFAEMARDRSELLRVVLEPYLNKPVTRREEDFVLAYLRKWLNKDFVFGEPAKFTRMRGTVDVK